MKLKQVEKPLEETDNEANKIVSLSFADAYRRITEWQKGA